MIYVCFRFSALRSEEIEAASESVFDRVLSDLVVRNLTTRRVLAIAVLASLWLWPWHILEFLLLVPSPSRTATVATMFQFPLCSFVQPSYFLQVDGAMKAFQGGYRELNLPSSQSTPWM